MWKVSEMFKWLNYIIKLQNALTKHTVGHHLMKNLVKSLFIKKWKERTPKDFQRGLNLRKFLGISVSVLIIQQRSSWVYLPVVVHTKWGFQKWNENSPQWHILALLGNVGFIWKCKDSVTEQGWSCLMSHFFTSLLQNTAIQSDFGLHCTSNNNSCTFTHLLIAPFCVASILLLTLFSFLDTCCWLLWEGENWKPWHFSVCNKAIADVQLLIQWEITSCIDVRKTFSNLIHSTVLMLSELKLDPEKISLYNHALSP